MLGNNLNEGFRALKVIVIVALAIAAGVILYNVFW